LVVFVAFNIYTAVQNFRKCELVKDQTWDALQKIRDAKKTYDEIWNNVTHAKSLMSLVSNDATAIRLLIHSELQKCWNILFYFS